MSFLFSKVNIGTVELSNRMIRTASHEGLADSRGRPTDEQFQFYKSFIEGGIGLIITGYAGISQAGKSALYHMNMIDSDELIPYHKKLVDRIHEIGGKIVLQICHCGRQTWSSVRLSTEDRTAVGSPSLQYSFFEKFINGIVLPNQYTQR